MSKSPDNQVSRRRVFAGAGAAGALAAAAVVLPGAKSGAEPAAEQAGTTPDRDGRYQVTQHVLRYYQTAKV